MANVSISVAADFSSEMLSEPDSVEVMPPEIDPIDPLRLRTECQRLQ